MRTLTKRVSEKEKGTRIYVRHCVCKQNDFSRDGGSGRRPQHSRLLACQERNRGGDYIGIKLDGDP